MRNRSQKGFTLIELLIVIAIIGILAAVLIPNLLNARARAYDSGAQSCANSLQTAQEIHWLDNDEYSDTPSGLPDLAVVCDDITFVSEGLDGDGWEAVITHPQGTGRQFTVTQDSLD